MTKESFKAIVEAMIFASDAPLEAALLIEILGNGLNTQNIQEIVELLNSDYDQTERAFRIEKIAGGYCLTTRPEFSSFIKQLYKSRTTTRLSSSSLECLAIVAIKQPVTRIEIDKIRGVNSSGCITSLLEKELITVTGHKKTVGNPLLYGTTETFLKHLGIDRVESLPNYEKIMAVVNKSLEEKMLLIPKEGNDAQKIE